MRAKPICPSLGALGRFTLAIVLVVSSGATAGPSPRWERTNAAGRQQGIVNAVCLPVSEIVCVGVGCRDQNGFDFVEMIVGDWLHGPTRLSAGPYYNDDRDGSRQAGVERPELARVPWTDRIVRFWHGLRATAACELRLWSPVIWQSFHSRGLDAPARAQEDLRCRTCYVIGAPSRCEASARPGQRNLGHDRAMPAALKDLK